MSKKIAAGADKILIDIKVGNGALLQTREDAEKLSELMIKIGKFYQREVRCMISDMNIPLGRCVGNSLEVLEAMDVLQGIEKDTNLVNLCIELASEMVSMGLEISLDEARKKVLQSIEDGSSYQKFLELVKYQKGDISKIKVSNETYEIKAPCSGKLVSIDALEVGKLSLALGAGKENIDDKIDYTVGVKLEKLVGDTVKKGDVVATLYYKKNIPKYDFKKIFIIQ